MPSICAGSVASQKKPAFAATVSIAPWGIGALLNNASTPWAVALSVLLGTLVYELNDFCTNNPPTLPTLVAQDAVDLMVGPVGGQTYIAAVSKFRDFIGYYAWFQFCECSSGTAPTPGSPQTQPTDWPQFNPLIPGPTLAVNPCSSISSGQFTTSGTTYVQQSVGLQAPTNATGLDFFATAVSGSVVPDSQYIVLRNLTANNFAGAGNIGLAANPANGTTQHVGLVGASPGAWYFLAARQINGVPMVGSMRLDIYCGGQNPSVSTGCQDCPPGPALQAAIDQLLGLVTLVQRRLAPIAYTLGSAHTGLTGQGSFSVDGLLGVKVELTTIPSSYGEQLGEPTMRFVDTWLSMMTDDGVINERQVNSTLTVWTPFMATEATTWGYSFGPGIVATITELEPEP